MCMDKLSHQLFSLLESWFLGGWWSPSGLWTPARALLDGGRVRVPTIDGCSTGAEDVLLAATALARLEAKLCDHTGDPDARVADFFDMAVGASAGGVLTAMLFLRGNDDRSPYSAQEVITFVAGSVGRKDDWCGRHGGRWARLFRGTSRSGGDDRMIRRVFDDATLRDTVALLLVPSYDLATAALFVFSRADAVESDNFDSTGPTH